MGGVGEVRTRPPLIERTALQTSQQELLLKRAEPSGGIGGLRLGEASSCTCSIAPPPTGRMNPSLVDTTEVPPSKALNPTAQGQLSGQQVRQWLCCNELGHRGKVIFAHSPTNLRM